MEFKYIGNFEKLENFGFHFELHCEDINNPNYCFNEFVKHIKKDFKSNYEITINKLNRMIEIILCIEENDEELYKEIEIVDANTIKNLINDLIIEKLIKEWNIIDNYIKDAVIDAVIRRMRVNFQNETKENKVKEQKEFFDLDIPTKVKERLWEYISIK